jgi:hypothetical protein
MNALGVILFVLVFELENRRTDFINLLYRGSRKSGATGELGYLANYGKNVKREKLLQAMCYQSQVLELLPRTSRYGATLFTLSTVKSYRDVATLT